MKKADFLLEDFKNIQELIRFADQKAAAILVVCGIIMTVFFEVSKKLTFTTINILKETNQFLNGIMIFILGVVFSIILVSIFYQCIFKILKPKFANNYIGCKSSIFYFEHIAKREKAEFKKEVAEIDEYLIINNLSDQIFETSNILYRKNKSCALTMNMLFVAVLNLLLYIFFIAII